MRIQLFDPAEAKAKDLKTALVTIVGDSYAFENVSNVLEAFKGPGAKSNDFASLKTDIKATRHRLPDRDELRSTVLTKKQAQLLSKAVDAAHKEHPKALNPKELKDLCDDWAIW